MKYTYYGDANLDGAVDGADYQQIDNGFGGGLTGWSNGDFNYDGVDLVLPADNTLNLKIAAWLNTTGKPIHIEATYVIKFQFVRIRDNEEEAK